MTNKERSEKEVKLLRELRLAQGGKTGPGEETWETSALEELGASILRQTVLAKGSPIPSAKATLDRVVATLTRHLRQFVENPSPAWSCADKGEGTTKLWATRRWPIQEMCLVRLSDGRLRLYIWSEEPSLRGTRVELRFGRDTYVGVLEPKPGGRMGAAIDVKVAAKLRPEDIEMALVPPASPGEAPGADKKEIKEGR